MMQASLFCFVCVFMLKRVSNFNPNTEIYLFIAVKKGIFSDEKLIIIMLRCLRKKILFHNLTYY